MPMLGEEKQQQELASRLDVIIEVLEEMIEGTEEYYQTLYDSLPGMERNIQLTEEETSLLINYFIAVGEVQKDGEEQYLISQALKQIRGSFNEIRDHLLNQGEIHELLEHFLGDETSDSSFQVFLNLIKEIEEILEDVSDVSLNAIIYSASLGVEGAGFRVISDHIHQISSRLEVEFSSIDSLLEELIKWHQKLQDDIEGIVSRQEKGVNEYIEGSEEVFNSVTASIQEVSVILRNLMSNVREVVSPFQELMTLIQRQDIVRQGLENAIKFFRIIRDKYEEYQAFQEGQVEDEEILDYAAFNSRALQLMQKLVHDISNSLEESLTSIIEVTATMLSSLEGVQEDSRYLTGYLADPSLISEDEDLAQVDYSFNSIFEFMNDFISILTQIRGLVEEISSDRNQFNYHMNGMDENMTLVHRRIGRLGKIRLMTKIELARMGERGNTFGAEIEDIVKEVEKTMDANRKAFVNMKEALQQDLFHFDRIIVDNQEGINRALDEVKGSMGQLETTNQIINQAITALNKEIEALYGQLEKIYSTLQNVEPMWEMKGKIEREIESLTELAEAEKEQVLKEHGQEDWSAQDRELLEFFDLFTSFIERNSAKEFVQEEEYDEGSPEGELTLF